MLDEISEQLYVPEKTDGILVGNCESNLPDIEEKFLDLICEMVVSSFKVSWQDRPLMRNVLSSVLHDAVCQRGGLLEQYLHSQLDILAKTIEREFGLDKDLKIDYNHCTHAKLDSLIQAIIEKQKSQLEIQAVDLLKGLDIIGINSFSDNNLEIIFRFNSNKNTVDPEYLKISECDHVWSSINAFPAKDIDISRCSECGAFRLAMYQVKLGVK